MADTSTARARQPRRTRTAQRGLQVPHGSPIAGQLLKAIRESLYLSQEQLAEALELDANTLQSWETGRRALASTRVTVLAHIRRELVRLGADPTAVARLDDAIEADHLLHTIVTGTPVQLSDGVRSPFASSVLRQGVVDMLAWPFTGQSPVRVPPLLRSRRGPSARQPMLSSRDRQQFFSTLRKTVEHSRRTHRGLADAQPHRQIYYLLQWDSAPSARSWLSDVEHAERRAWSGSNGWTPRWVTARSAAITQARHTSPEPLRQFVASGLDGQPACEDADLNYWAYWLDEVPDEWRSDDAMAGGLLPWAGGRLLGRFCDRLTAEEPLIDLYAHSTAALLARRPHLLAAPGAAAALMARLEPLFDGGNLHAGTQVTLERVRYALRLAHH
jgi:DNA-binding transcriptional regulator YiaG